MRIFILYWCACAGWPEITRNLCVCLLDYYYTTINHATGVGAPGGSAAVSAAWPPGISGDVEANKDATTNGSIRRKYAVTIGTKD